MANHDRLPDQFVTILPSHRTAQFPLLPTTGMCVTTIHLNWRSSRFADFIYEDGDYTMSLIRAAGATETASVSITFSNDWDIHNYLVQNSRVSEMSLVFSNTSLLEQEAVKLFQQNKRMDHITQTWQHSDSIFWWLSQIVLARNNAVCAFHWHQNRWPWVTLVDLEPL